ncbi:hypothetical protein TSA1_18455 [Bradyrhizobium nitroreducens]|uniref:DUF308 domain-containing protein n=1 Tax=Bradyrhizobium nitroreducens TaxID=709803 RepID=A0A2M6UD39_9BRAD|nr:DUF308 domain-containing protein [Bradyrhizobium nitroreducens]PIT02514.1 hypothetical protein TSA1_18455 [Bradyrhizobium nitroreducens]
MTLALLIAGIFAVVAGLLSILFGFSVREFSLGSPLIVSGTIGVCSGMLLIGLHVVVQELKAIARRLAGAPSEVRVRPVLPGLAGSGAAAPDPMSAAAARTETRMEPAPPPPPAAGPPPWQGEAAARERPRVEVPPEPEAPPPVAPEAPRRRNLMFASTSRKERERAEAKATETPSPQPEPSEAPDIPPASFDDAWPKPDRSRPPEPPAGARRPMPPPRSPSTFAEAAPPPAPEPPSPPPAPAEQPPVTVLKSGVVDGMAYSLYSDGSIEAQMPEGMMRFASIDELRTHLDQRG